MFFCCCLTQEIMIQEEAFLASWTLVQQPPVERSLQSSSLLLDERSGDQTSENHGLVCSSLSHIPNSVLLKGLQVF